MARDMSAGVELLTEKNNGYTTEARRAYDKKLVNTMMEPGQPGDFLFFLNEYRDLLEEIRPTRHDERHKDIILQALPPEYERLRTASYERRDFGLDDICHMVHNMYVDNLSRSVNPKPIAGHGIAMQLVGHANSDVQCKCCKRVGHVTQDCAILN